MALISLEQVSKIYPRGSRPALDTISLEVERGEFVFLVGASGSGKTSLLRLLLHEEQATEGDIRVAGNDLRRMSNRQVPHYRRSIGFVFQDYKLLPNKTVWENVAFALEVIGAKRSMIRTLVPQVLETVGLTGKEDRRPQELSGGEQQRVAIARAYVNHPSLLLADEPTGNLDPTTSVGIMEVLEAINRTGTTIVMATHNEEIVNSMRKRVIELHNGKIVRDEKHGSYDSTRYFPDAEVEAKAQRVIGVDHSLRKQVLADTAGSVKPQDMTSANQQDSAATLTRKLSGDSREQEVAGSIQAVAQAAQLVSEDEGIARLAQSVHTGRKGKYGEAFVSLEDTLTWGKGLQLDEMRKHEEEQAAQQSTSSPEASVQSPEVSVQSPEHSRQPQEHTKFMPPAPPKPPTTAPNNAVSTDSAPDPSSPAAPESDEAANAESTPSESALAESIQHKSSSSEAAPAEPVSDSTATENEE